MLYTFVDTSAEKIPESFVAYLTFYRSRTKSLIFTSSKSGEFLSSVLFLILSCGFKRRKSF